MAQIKINQFTEYELTEQEQLAGAIFTENNLMVLQNLRSQQSSSILQMEVNPSDYPAYVQQEAFARGQLAMLDFILENHIQCLAEIMNAASEDKEDNAVEIQRSTNSNTSGIFNSVP